MARCREAGAAHDLRDLAAEQRDLAGAAVVGDRGQQSHEQPLADHRAGRVEPLDADGVEIGRPVDGGAAIGLGHHQQPRLAEEMSHLDRQRVEVAQAFEDPETVVAQDAEAASRDRAHRRLVALAGEGIVAIAQIGVVIVLHPGEEIAALGDLVGGQRRRPVVELGDDLRHLLAHRRPIGHRGADVAQHHFEIGPDGLDPAGVGLLADPQLHPGFGVVAGPGQAAGRVAGDPQHRVDHEIDGEVALVERGSHRIDQERHVVIDDLDDAVRAAPAMVVELRIVDPELGLPGLPLLPEVPQRRRSSGGTLA